MEKSKLNPASPPVAESMINDLLDKGETLNTEQLVKVLRKMGTREFT